MFGDSHLDPLFSRRHIAHGLLLAFVAGNVNVGAYLAVHRFVSHVTSFATLFGASVASGDWRDAFGILSVPLFFLAGAVMAGLMIDRRLHQERTPRLTEAYLLVVLCLLAADLMGKAHHFGSFGEALVLRRDYLLLALLCTASGLMNGLTTSASRGALRSTHLSGTTTDLGLGIVRAIYPTKNAKLHRREVRANWLRLGTIVAFVLGSLSGAYAFVLWDYNGFLLPIAVVLGQTVHIALCAKSRTQ